MAHTKMKDVTHMMVDIEALGQIIVSVGVYIFEVNGKCHYKQNYILKATQQEKLGLNPDISTLKWWFKQDEAAKDQLFQSLSGNGLMPIEFFTEMNKLVDKYKPKRFWSRSPWDYVSIERLYKVLNDSLGGGVKYPFRRSLYRDERDLLDIANSYDLQLPERVGNWHNAADDAHTQANTVISVYKHLGKT